MTKVAWGESPTGDLTGGAINPTPWDGDLHMTEPPIYGRPRLVPGTGGGAPTGGQVTGGPYYAPPGLPGGPTTTQPAPYVNPPAPATGTPIPATDPNAPAATAPAGGQGSLGIDLSGLSGLLGGSIFGIPITYIVIAGVIYFFFIKKGRR